MKLTKVEKMDVIRLIGEELSREYRNGRISIGVSYDTSTIDDNTDIEEATKRIFLEPYTRRIENGETELMSELQYVLASIRSTISQYAKIKEQDRKQQEESYSLTVGKALSGDKGSSYG